MPGIRNECNLMVTEPGGYEAKDFARTGAGLAVTMAVPTVLVLSL